MSDTDVLTVTIEVDASRANAAFARAIAQVQAFYNALPVRVRHAVAAHRLGLNRHHVRTVTRRKQRGHR